jgi:hypothetical protein
MTDPSGPEVDPSDEDEIEEEFLPPKLGGVMDGADVGEEEFDEFGTSREDQ